MNTSCVNKNNSGELCLEVSQAIDSCLHTLSVSFDFIKIFVNMLSKVLWVLSIICSYEIIIALNGKRDLSLFSHSFLSVHIYRFLFFQKSCCNYFFFWCSNFLHLDYWEVLQVGFIVSIDMLSLFYVHFPAFSCCFAWQQGAHIYVYMSICMCIYTNSEYKTVYICINRFLMSQCSMKELILIFLLSNISNSVF